MAVSGSLDSATVARLEQAGVRVHCLALGGVDLTSSAGRMTMGVINAVAQFERDLLVERTQSGLARARAQGKRLGRPHSLDADAREVVLRTGGGAEPDRRSDLRGGYAERTFKLPNPMYVIP